MIWTFEKGDKIKFSSANRVAFHIDGKRITQLEGRKKDGSGLRVLRHITNDVMSGVARKRARLSPGSFEFDILQSRDGFGKTRITCSAKDELTCFQPRASLGTSSPILLGYCEEQLGILQIPLRIRLYLWSLNANLSNNRTSQSMELPLR